MTFRVLFFAVLAHETGLSETTVDVAEGATVGDAVDALAAAHPVVAKMRGQLAVAVDMAYVNADHVLVAGNQLALIPPVSGG